MAKLLDMNTILSLNKDPKSMDLHNMALARSKNAKVAPGSAHDFIADRMRTKDVKGMDEAFRTINTLAKNGTLDLWRKKFGNQYNMGVQGTKGFKESSFIDSKIQGLIEEFAAAIASSTGAPIATFGGGATSIENSYAKPQIVPDQKSHQDPGAAGRKKDVESKS